VNGSLLVLDVIKGLIIFFVLGFMALITLGIIALTRYIQRHPSQKRVQRDSTE